MTNRERALAILNYQPYDRMPLVHFGYWGETLEKWCQEGHLSREEIHGWGDGNAVDAALSRKIGWDFDWQCMVYPDTGLRPGFESKVIEEFPDGSRSVLNGDGMIVHLREGATSIPAEVGHLLTGREAWEELYLPKLQYSEDRLPMEALASAADDAARESPLGLHCGSLYGQIRNWLGVQGSCYLLADDAELFTEIIDTVGELCYRCTEAALASGARFDFAHFWEDICFKNGPLISPAVFKRKVGLHYRRITDLVAKAGIPIVSLDCDGCIDRLVPIWLENGVNTMFPIEVGTWEASIAPWREQYGRDLRGVGGMDKRVFAQDRAAVDTEIERLKSLVDLGGYIPCPDHRIAPDAEFDNVRYYCDRMRAVFG
ncbi:MAG TPA: uroporphyrinogen decarboxylase family protein [Armatimonadota bacterium]